MSRSSYDGFFQQHVSAHWRQSSSESVTNLVARPRSRALSFRSGKTSGRGPAGGTTGRPGLSFNSLRGQTQPELSRKLFKLIKSENNLISAHEAAGKERVSIAQQLSEWGENTGDEAISDLSDKVGVILSEIGEQEDTYAHALDDSRAVLKTIRNTEKSVQPSRDGKSKIADEIQKLKMKEPESARLVVLEQELIRAEAENLVAEAQLTNIVRKPQPSRSHVTGIPIMLTCATDPSETQGGLRCRVYGNHRACREADHSGQARPPSSELAG
jgi:hypothetical protein